ncbi:MaoC family dehydratase [Pelagibacterium mangrovi]|uniref:MaoC family dehydratase n=1 Tax=Pelagibacterium mangrovi TaxID=3119828 RepID=UPI002FCC580F
MTARAFEDFVVGERWESGPATLSEADIIAFGRANDPQPIHCDPVAASNGRFGGLIASGWQVTTLAMRLFVESGGYGDTPVVGMGIDELRWRRPVRPGDRLRVVREVVEARRSTSKPMLGIIRTRVSVVNQDGEVVMTMISIGQVPARTAGQ